MTKICNRTYMKMSTYIYSNEIFDRIDQMYTNIKHNCILIEDSQNKCNI